MRALGVVVLFTSLIVGLAGARAADVPGSKDPEGFKRFQGSDIIYHTERSFDRYVLARGEGDPNNGFAQSETVEGKVTRLLYRLPTGHTSLEAFRNYEQMLSDAGFARTFELDKGSIGYDGAFLGKLWGTNSNNPVYDSENRFYATYKATKNGQDISVAIFSVESNGIPYGGWMAPGAKEKAPVDHGQVLVVLDLVAAKAVEQHMVEVKAADMADALATKGSVDLYGIYFDVDKTDIKPESTKTLDEVANLLKIDRSLKLEIAGHTDNTGAAAHNKTLSEGRAQAVVDMLVKKYGIDTARLQAKGYGDTKPVASNDTDDGKAKNRRVELKKL